MLNACTVLLFIIHGTLLKLEVIKDSYEIACLLWSRGQEI